MTILQCVSLSTKHTPLLSVSLSLSLSLGTFFSLLAVSKRVRPLCRKRLPEQRRLLRQLDNSILVRWDTGEMESALVVLTDTAILISV